MKKAKKIIFVVTEDWFFCSHRLSIAKAALNAGYEVATITQVKHHKATIESHGIKVIPFKISRSGCNPLTEFMTIISLYKIYKRENPDLLHHVAIKPILYGTIAAKLSGVPIVINAVTGLGYIYISKKISARIIRLIVSPMLKIIFDLRNSFTIFQNKDDQKSLQSNSHSIDDQSIIIMGSGVDHRYYTPAKEKPISPCVVLGARMLIDKGIREYVDAARIVKKEFKEAKFLLAGDTDSGNPAMIKKSQLGMWKGEGVIEWEGHQEDMLSILQKSNIACLPSYREGMPKFLLEAASCGLSIVTTDVPGCREVVQNNQNGFLVPAKNPILLADAIIMLIKDSALRDKFGNQSRAMVENMFSSEIINKQTISLYKSLFRKL